VALSKTLRISLSGLFRILRRFWPQIRKQLPLIGGSLLALLAEIGLRLLEPWPLKFIFDRVIVTSPDSRSVDLGLGDTGQTVGQLALAVLAVVLIAGLRAGASYLNTVSLALAGNRVAMEIRTRLYRHLLHLSLSYHSRARSGDLLTRIMSDIGRLQEVAVTALLPTLVHSLTLVGMVGLMFWMNWPLALMALAVFPLFFLSTLRISGRIREVARKQRRREGAMAATAAESIGAIEVVQAFCLEDTLERTFSAASRKSFKEGVRGKRLASRLERTVDVLIAIDQALVLGYGAWLVLRGASTPGDLLVFLSYLKGAFRPMRDLAKYTGRLAKATAASERVLDVLDTPSDVTDLPGATPAPTFYGETCFENVCFGYELSHPVLKDISFEALPGQCVALVGPSGSGKSTLASLLLRLHDPQLGCIRIDGADLRTYTLSSLRAQISIVLQESTLFGVSIRDNITCGLQDVTPEQVEIAARLANAHDFIMELPAGYDTVLGERGVTLSGGERQRIAIARAAVREAPIVILDEPATGLDNENEHAVQEALERLTWGRTTFLIAHDLRSTERADLILYLDRGRIAECGTHRELMRQRGRYAAMYNLQSLSWASEEPEQVELKREVARAFAS
jgi:ATP-binding cassette subfamily B protein